MPIYEYQCRRCDHRLETLQGMNDAPLEICPACNKKALVKLVSAAAFRLKGGGWYETDFKNPKKPETKQEPKESAGDQSKNTKDAKDAKDTKDTKPAQSDQAKGDAKPAGQS